MLKEKMLDYYKALGTANNLGLNIQSIEKNVIAMFIRLADGELVIEDIDYLKRSENLVTQHIVKKIFGIKLTKTPTKNNEILSAYMDGLLKPAINWTELDNKEKLIFVKPKMKDYTITDIKIEKVFDEPTVTFFMETKGGLKEFSFKYETETHLSSEFVYVVTRFETSNTVAETLSTKYLNSLDQKQIKDLVRNTEEYQVEETKYKLMTLFN